MADRTDPAPRARVSRQASVTTGAALLPLRLFLGGTFVYAGMQKLSDPGYLTRGSSTYIGTQLQQFAHGTPGGFLLRAIAIPHPALTGVLTALLELFVGLLVLAGLLTRWAAAAGMLFNLLLFLTNSWKTHPYFLGSDIVFVFAWLPIALAGAAGQPAVDTWLQTRRARAPSRAGASRGSRRAGSARGRVGGAAASGPAALSRRAVLRVGLGAAGAATAALAGISVFIRNRRPPAAVTSTARLGDNPGGSGAGAGTTAANGASGSASATTTGTTATAASGSSPASAAGAGALPKGAVRLGPVSRLPVGQAALYTDPVDHSPDIVLRRGQGTFSALSAVCTHAGCTVQYQSSPSGPQLVCPCHGSVFDAVTGAVIQGPAIQPLPRREVLDHGGTLYAVPTRG
jgi:thiosulfate dehydrogenase [quinone] large subunit